MIDPKWIGYRLPPAELAIDRARLRFFAKAIGETDPVYTDVAAARAAGYADLPVPPTFLFAAELDSGAIDQLLDDVGIPIEKLLHGEQGFTWYQPVCAGDTVTVQSTLTDIYAKKGGALEFVVKVSDVTNQDGQRVAELRSVLVCRHATATAPATAPDHSPTTAPSMQPCPAPVCPQAPQQEAAPGGSKITAAMTHTPAPGGPVCMQVGQVWPTLALPPVNRQTLALFAGASGDHNPIHIDLDFARQAGSPDVFAHGMLGMAWMGRLLTAWVPQHRLRRLDVRFQGITQLGDAIQCTGHVVALLTHNGEPCARVALSSANQHGQTRIVGEALVACAPA